MSRMNKNRVMKLSLLTLVISLIALFYFMGGSRYLELSFIQNKLNIIQDKFAQSPWEVTLIFTGIYILITSLSIPGAIILTLLSGAIFGTFPGSLLVTFSSTTGAALAFLMSRYLFRDFMQRRLARTFHKMNRKVKQEGRLYLFILRMVPVSPFVVINLAMGLTNMRLWSYVWITFLGMYPGTYIYVYAGQKISEITDISQILSWPIMLSLTALGLFPYLARQLARNLLRKRTKLMA